jgi:translation initiation factor IF-3
MSVGQALELAQGREMDLVEVAPNVDPPVCKLMDFDKLRYKQKKRQKESHRTQQLKEITVRLKIGQHDLDTKVKHIKRFLSEGHKVKLNVHMRGREKDYAGTLGVAMLDKVSEDLKELAIVERKSTAVMGNRIHLILAPVKTGDTKHAKDENAQGDRQAG